MVFSPLKKPLHVSLQFKPHRCDTSTFGSTCTPYIGRCGPSPPGLELSMRRNLMKVFTATLVPFVNSVLADPTINFGTTRRIPLSTPISLPRPLRRFSCAPLSHILPTRNTLLLLFFRILPLLLLHLLLHFKCRGFEEAGGLYLS